MRIHILDRGEEKKENSLNSRFSFFLSLSLCTRIWDGLDVREKRRIEEKREMSEL
jgi:hypothetical protein